METVVVKKCKEYNLFEIKNKIEEGLKEFGEIKKIIKKNEKVLIKVNSLSDAPPEKAVNTHPIFLQSVIQIIKTQTKNIYVGDSPGPGFKSFIRASHGNKMWDIIEKEGVIPVEFKEEVEIKRDKNLAYKSFKVSSIINKIDKIINIPKLKTHTLMYMTLSVKNMFGLIPGNEKMNYHLKSAGNNELFAKMLVDLYLTRPPDFTFVDGIIGIEGNGPGAEGNPINTGIIIMGKDGFAIDDLIPRLTGIKPEKVYTNYVYRKYYLNNKEPEYIIKGDDIKEIKTKIKPPQSDLKKLIPEFVYNLARDLVTPKPIFRKEKCTGCLKCVISCPAEALKYDKNKKKIICDYKKCIRCYVCHEMCPEGSIKISKPLLSFIIKK